jgi:hypothetical protein
MTDANSRSKSEGSIRHLLTSGQITNPALLQGSLSDLSPETPQCLGRQNPDDVGETEFPVSQRFLPNPMQH